MIPDAPVAPRQLSDAGAIALALATAMGARSAIALPLALFVATIAVAVIAVGARRPVLLVLAVGLLAAGLSHRSLAGLASPPHGHHDGVVTLVADPARSAFGANVDVRLADGTRVQLRAHDGAAGALERSLAGERAHVVGILRPPAPGSGWMIPRHLAGTLEAEHIERVDGGRAPWRAANRFRRLLVRGASNLGDDTRSLYLGFVVGDDRDQRAEIVDDFRGTGLSHLMVVSGQNVAYTLILAGPLLRRLTWRGRWALTLAVIGAFAVVTRFEPSVLRASAMAAIAVTGRALGRPAPAHRTLALAVTGLLLIDPLLVWSIGFRLSVAASLALAVLARPIADRLRGPRVIREGVAASIAAQIGVAPILIPLAGGLPVASLPANVLAVPVAGLVTTYGLPAGVVAGLLGPAAGRWVHLPTRWCIAWVAGVARVGAGLALGQLGAFHVVALTALIALVLVTRSGLGWRRWVATVAAALVVLHPAWQARHPHPVEELAVGAVIHRAGGATVVEAPERPNEEDLLEQLRLAGIRRIDLLVVAGDGQPVAALLSHRWSIARVVDERTAPERIRVGGVEVVVTGRAAPDVRASAP